MPKLNPTHLRSIALDACVSFCQGITIILLPSLGLEIRAIFSPESADWLWSLVFVPGISTSLVAMRCYPMATLAWGNHYVYRLGILANILFFIFLYIFASVPKGVGWIFLLTAMIFHGISFAWITAAINMRVSVYFPKNMHSGLSAIHALFCLGAFFCPLYVEYIRNVSHWRFACIAPAFSMLALVILTKPIYQGVPNLTRQKRSISPLEKFIYILIFLYGIAEAILGNWAAVYVGEVKQLSSGTVAVCLSLFWVFMATGRIAGSFLAAHLSRIKLHAFYTCVAFLGVALILQASESWQMIGAYAMTGLGCSIFFPFAISAAANANQDMDEIVSANSITALLIGIGISGPVAGILLNIGSLKVDILFWMASLTFGCLFLAVSGLSILRKDQLE